MDEGNPSPKPRDEIIAQARVLTGPRAGKIVKVVEEQAGMTTAIFTDDKGVDHRFKAPSIQLQKVRSRTFRRRKKKDN